MKRVGLAIMTNDEYQNEVNSEVRQLHGHLGNVKKELRDKLEQFHAAAEGFRVAKNHTAISKMVSDELSDFRKQMNDKEAKEEERIRCLYKSLIDDMHEPSPPPPSGVLDYGPIRWERDVDIDDLIECTVRERYPAVGYAEAWQGRGKEPIRIIATEVSMRPESASSTSDVPDRQLANHRKPIPTLPSSPPATRIDRPVSAMRPPQTEAKSTQTVTEAATQTVCEWGGGTETPLDNRKDSRRRRKREVDERDELLTNESLGLTSDSLAVSATTDSDMREQQQVVVQMVPARAPSMQTKESVAVQPSKQAERREVALQIEMDSSVHTPASAAKSTQTPSPASPRRPSRQRNHDQPLITFGPSPAAAAAAAPPPSAPLRPHFSQAITLWKAEYFKHRGEDSPDRLDGGIRGDVLSLSGSVDVERLLKENEAKLRQLERIRV
ncbi:unnamed protein product [Vitrella brassicaformis CCMP3155]|uniref:Uncharacterized protein n=2 Tax=Vitrella brassicaformis TaxID=1169539 RepID=A0A0G4FAT9_VITBC|nr:unnamed protein product [Vitrella brassicaformis CCMP3155]|eukprot:CEM09734.1 unnamed protein product [Vitrella brassicaformis CCMP3155]